MPVNFAFHVQDLSVSEKRDNFFYFLLRDSCLICVLSYVFSNLILPHFFLFSVVLILNCLNCWNIKFYLLQEDIGAVSN